MFRIIGSTLHMLPFFVLQIVWYAWNKLFFRFISPNQGIIKFPFLMFYSFRKYFSLLLQLERFSSVFPLNHFLKSWFCLFFWDFIFLLYHIAVFCDFFQGASRSNNVFIILTKLDTLLSTLMSGFFQVFAIQCISGTNNLNKFVLFSIFQNHEIYVRNSFSSPFCQSITLKLENDH